MELNLCFYKWLSLVLEKIVNEEELIITKPQIEICG